jgi:hypothetical protein
MVSLPLFDKQCLEAVVALKMRHAPILSAAIPKSESVALSFTRLLEFRNLQLSNVVGSLRQGDCRSISAKATY